jgi:hypothetical protein
MKRAAVLPFLLFALACADTPTDVAPDDLALAADHHGNKVVLMVNAGAQADVSPALGGTIFPEGSFVGWSMTARQTASGEVSGRFHFNPSRINDIVVHLEVTCLAVSGNTAYVGATNLSWRQGNEKNESLIGWESVTRLTDNGEGAGAEPDEITDASSLEMARETAGLPEGTCEDPEIQAALDDWWDAIELAVPVARGNVQIIDKR